jgi:hypothetical protein
VGVLLVDDDDTGGDAGAIKEVGGHANDAGDVAFADEGAADTRQGHDKGFGNVFFFRRTGRNLELPLRNPEDIPRAKQLDQPLPGSVASGEFFQSVKADFAGRIADRFSAIGKERVLGCPPEIGDGEQGLQKRTSKHRGFEWKTHAQRENGFFRLA